MAKVLGAKVVKPSEVDPKKLSKYDLIGFGSGVYFMQFHRTLSNFINTLPSMSKRAFIFSTAGSSRMHIKCHADLKKKLEERGFTIVADFSCPGYDTFGPLQIFGGLNKGRPNKDDLENASKFAKDLLRK